METDTQTRSSGQIDTGYLHLPKNSNDFQRLVLLIEEALAPVGAKVTESAMIPTEDHPDGREIDILIESQLGPYSIKVAVEAKDESRKMDITRFEEIIGKYSKQSGIRVDKLVVVSRKGFCKPVVKRAERENVSLLRLSEAINADWSQHIPQDLVLSVGPHLAGFEFEPALPKNIAHLAAINGQLVCECCGRSHGTPLGLANQLLMSREFVQSMKVAASRAGASVFTKPSWHLGDKVLLRSGDAAVPLKSFSVHCHCLHARGLLALKSFNRGNRTIQHLSGDFGGQHLEFVLPDGMSSHKIAMRFDRFTIPVSSSKGQHSIAMPPIAVVADEAVPAQHGPLVKLLVEYFTGTNVTVEQNVLMHDLASGEDFRVPLAVKIRLSDHDYLQSAVVFRECTSEDDVQWAQRWLGRVRGAKLDKLAIVYSSPISQDAAQLLRNTSTVKIVAEESLRSAKDLVELSCPQIWLWAASVWSLQCSFFTDSGERTDADSKDATIVIGSHRESRVDQYLGGIVQSVTTHPASAIRGAMQGDSIWTEAKLESVAQFPPDSRWLSSGGQSLPLSHLRITLTLRAAWGCLDQCEVEDRGGSRCVQFSSSSGFSTKVRTAMLPQRGGIELAGNPLGEPHGVVFGPIDAEVFQRIGLTGPIPLSSSATQIAHIPSEKTKGHWTLRILKPTDIEQFK